MTGRIKSLCLDFARLKVKISTNYAKYYDYLRLYFEQIISSQDFKHNADIEIDVCWQKAGLNAYLGALKKSVDLAQIGANILISENRVVSVRKIERKRKVIFDFRPEGREFHVKAILLWKMFKDTIRYNIFGRSQEDWFFSVTFPFLYYPVFWYLEYFMHTHMLHSSALEFSGKSIIICGLEGTGKTSLALSLLQQEGARFLCDNLIFYDSEKIYPCYELIRIHKNEDSCLWKGKFKKVNEFSSLKDFYKPVFKYKQEGIKPDILIFPQFSSRFFTKELSLQEAVYRATILSQLPSELSNYDEFRRLYNLSDLNFNPQVSQYKALDSLLNSVRCYIVGMPKADGLKRNAERLKDFISNEQ